MQVASQHVPATPKGHPKGLNVLFATEMWERFNFYGMRALLTLFLVHALAFRESEASIIYGGFLGLCYLTPMLGGYISDRYLGNRNCILLGGATMSIGQLFMFASAIVYANNVAMATTLMWIALGILIIGNGFFKPNISSMVGQLYPKSDNRLDSAFTIFYMGINLGAFLGITICPIVGDVKIGDVRVVTAFKWGFLAAGTAMALGTILFFFLKDKYVVSPEGKPVGARPRFKNAGDAIGTSEAAQRGEAEKAHFTSTALMGSLIALVALVAAFKFVVDLNWIYSFIYASGITLAGLIMTDKSLTKIERDRIIVMYFVAFFVIFFWACFEQSASSLTFIADNQTDRRLFGWDMPPSLVQNANSLFIIILALPFSYMWLWLQRRKMEPISTMKQALGLIILAIGFLIIAMQVKGMGINDKIGVIWLIVMYLFHTIGELWLSPIGLSLVAKLAPVRFSSLLMGVWFLANAAGYALAGTLGALLPPTGDKYKRAADMGIDLQAVLDKTTPVSAEVLAKLNADKLPTEYPVFAGFTIHNLFEFFMVFVILPGAAGIILFLLSGWLKKMMHGVR
ncbi:MAG TPA: peptide MFS transporter [Chitinophagaceae bacterium]|nr:peptide MFS transporter [Chitinophagaceae bacterium]